MKRSELRNIIKEELLKEDLRSILQSADPDSVRRLKDAFYGIGDHISGFEKALQAIQKETGQIPALKPLNDAIKLLKQYRFKTVEIGRVL